MNILKSNNIKKEELLKNYGNLNIVTSVSKMVEKIEAFKNHDIIGVLGIFLTLVLNLYFCNFKDIGFLKANQLEYIYFFITFIIFIILLYQIRQKVRSKKLVDIYKDIVNESIKGEKPTALFIIKSRISGKNTILVERGSWGCYFLPYYNYDHDLEFEKQFEIMKKNIAEQIDVPENSMSIEYLKSMDTKNIKRYKPNNDERLFEYKFFFVKINPVNFHKISRKAPKKWEWKTLSELEDDGTTMAYNYDIISTIKELKCIETLNESIYEAPILEEPIKIIWNITNKCPYQCKLCGVNSDLMDSRSKELSKEEKIRALVSISTIREYIKEIDFAGGDPLASKENIDIIKYANCIFSKDIITVSTTGISLKKMNNSDIEQLFKACDLTYDFPRTMNKSDPRGADSDYNYYNFTEGKKLTESGIDVNIQIPILPENTKEDIIRILVKDIKEIRPKSVTLIRYMPVGRSSFKDYPVEYNPGECWFVKHMLHQT